MSESVARKRRGLAGIVGRAFDRLTQLECLVAVMALSLSAAALVADIISRELFRFGLFGSLRVAVYATAVAALSGFAICVATGAHLRITVFDKLVPEAWRPLVARAGNLLSFLICAYFTYWAVFYIRQTAAIGETDPSLGIKVWPIQCVLAWMFISGGARYLAFAVFPELQPAEVEPAS